MYSEHVDAKAWMNNPSFQHVYNKLWLCRTQNIKCAPCPIKPESYPVFYKPIINFYSLGAYAFKASSEIDEDREHPGLFWMEYVEGDHYTVDGYWNKNEFRTEVIFKANKEEDIFQYWIPSSHDLEFIRDWAREHLSDYKGPINFEWIGDTIIECHLRNSSQLKKAYSHDKNEYRCIVPIFGGDVLYTVDNENLQQIEDSFPNADITITIVDQEPELGVGNSRRMGYIIHENLQRGMEIKELVHQDVIHQTT